VRAPESGVRLARSHGPMANTTTPESTPDKRGSEQLAGITAALRADRRQIPILDVPWMTAHVRWLVEHGFGSPREMSEVAVLRSRQ
jgi:hypothetical protein